MNIRAIEKSQKLGFMFYIKYNGNAFDAFDEMKDKKTVKGTFRDIMTRIGLTWAKTIQQAARTDSKVSSNENILYVSSNYTGDLISIQEKFNEITGRDLKITMITKTLPNLILPDMIQSRRYVYSPSEKYIKNSPDDIRTVCRKLSGTYDVSDFTDAKGKTLKNHVRTIHIEFINNKLILTGDSFMPHQVRIMASYILCGEKKLYPAKFLTLDEITISQSLQDIILENVETLHFDNVNKIEKTKDNKLYIFYVNNDKKSQIIGKNGKNIAAIKAELNADIIVKEL